MPELRLNPITQKWVVIATERSKRPENFVVNHQAAKVAMDPFAEGNESMTLPEIFVLPDATPETPPRWKIRVIGNKFPILGVIGEDREVEQGIYIRRDGIGASEIVVTNHPKRYEAKMTPHELAELIAVFQARYNILSVSPQNRYVLIFKNHGAEAGASIPHPHHQIVAMPIVSNDIADEIQGAKIYKQRHKKNVMEDIIEHELKEKTRIVFENKDFVVFCPYFSSEPFEMWLSPKRHSLVFGQLKKSEELSMADALQAMLGKLSNTLGDPAFNYIIRTAPTDDKNYDFFCWYLRLFPRLTVRAGFEMGTGMGVNTVAPEEAAKFLRKSSRKVKN